MAKGIKDLETLDLIESIGSTTTTGSTETEKRARGRKKGCFTRQCRFNLGMTKEINDYIRVMSKLKGCTFNDFICEILEQSYNDNKELYESAKAFSEALTHSRHNAIFNEPKGSQDKE